MSNLGTISYTAEIETQKVLSGGAAVNKQLDNLQSGFNKTDKAAAGSSKRMTTLGNSMDTSGAKASKFSFALAPLAGAIAGVVSAQALVNLQKLGEQFTLLESRVKRLSASAEDARTNYAALLQISSAGGSDLTTTIKLWESLTASLRSLGVTRDQVLSLTDTLQKIGKIGGSSAEEISAALRQFSQAVAGGTLRAEEFNSIIEQMPELGRKIADGLGIPFNELRQQMLDGKLTIDRVLTAVYEQTGKVNAEFKNVPRTVGDATNAIVNGMGMAISKIDQATGASKELAKSLDNIARDIRGISGNASESEKLVELVNKRTIAEQQYATQVKFGLKTTAEATKSRIDGYNKEIKAIQDSRIEQQKAESQKLKITAPKNAPKTDSQKALDDLQKEAELTRLVGVERAKLQAKQKLGPTAKPEEIEAAQKLAAEIYNLENARKSEGATNKKEKTDAEQLAKKTANEEKRGIEQNIEAYTKLGSQLAAVGQNARDVAMQQAELSLNEYATPEQIQQVRDMAGALYDLNEAKANKALLGQVDPFAAEQQSFETQIANLQKLNDAKLLSDQRYLELKGQLETEHNAQMILLDEQRFAAQSKGNALIISTLNQVQSAATNAFTGLITGASDGTQAVQALAGAILNEAVGAVVAFGFAQLKSLIIGQTVGTAATAAAVGQAGIAAAAWATPAALASLATLGGNAVPAGAALTGTVGIAQGLALGARQYGGPTSAGGMYRVNETGAPEIFNAANGRQYMMPNTRGEVVSNKDATSGGGGSATPIVNVNNYSGQQATATGKYSEADKAFIVDVIVGDMQGGGKTAQTTNQITGTQRAGR
jgi:tape measure domain-containing protein|nr:MAG TPA: tail length tape measure protein [Caudoviricetes sp.]